MAKIGENNKRRRTTEEMAQDISFILNADELTYAAKYDVIHGVTWQWTQRTGLKRGNEIWSKEAIENYLRYHQKVKISELDRLYREEHIVPRKIIIDYLFDLSQPTDWKNIHNYLSKNLKSIVLTLEENKEIDRMYRSSMPASVDTNGHFDEWARYRESSVVVKSVTWRKSGRSLLVDDVKDYFN
jgi:hypothetical protein